MFLRMLAWRDNRTNSPIALSLGLHILETTSFLVRKCWLQIYCLNCQLCWVGNKIGPFFKIKFLRICLHHHLCQMASVPTVSSFSSSWLTNMLNERLCIEYAPNNMFFTMQVFLYGIEYDKKTARFPVNIIIDHGGHGKQFFIGFENITLARFSFLQSKAGKIKP